VRSLGAVSGGLLKELGDVALPKRVRRTSFYRTAIEVTLRFLIEEVGQVRDVYPNESRLSHDFLLRRGASHGLELIGLVTLHVSPIWIFAVLADAAGAGSKLIDEVSQALKEEGLLDKQARFETVEQLLDGLEQTSSHLAEALNTPPLDVTQLRREWLRLKAELTILPRAALPSAALLTEIWGELKNSAKAQNRSVFALCSAVAIAALAEMPANVIWLSRAAQIAASRTGTIVGQGLLNHYRSALSEIARCGFFPYWRPRFRPYLRAAADQFMKHKLSTTQRLIARFHQKNPPNTYPNG
jgi:hypothetical protein